MDNLYKQILENQSRLDTKIDEMTKLHSNQYTQIIEKQTELKVGLEDLKGMRDDIKSLRNDHIKDINEIKKEIVEEKEDITTLTTKTETQQKEIDEIRANIKWVVITVVGIVIAGVLSAAFGI